MSYFFYLNIISSTLDKCQTLLYVALPTMTPYNLSFYKKFAIYAISVIPPLIENLSFGNNYCIFKTLSYISGGTFLFYFGLSPFKYAFLA